jgi:Mitochondrial ribosomal protein L31
MSAARKSRVRERLRNVDEVIATIRSSGVQCHSLERLSLLPTEAEMEARDKYTTFSRKGRDFRKSVHKVSKEVHDFHLKDRY